MSKIEYYKNKAQSQSESPHLLYRAGILFDGVPVVRTGSEATAESSAINHDIIEAPHDHSGLPTPPQSLRSESGWKQTLRGDIFQNPFPVGKKYDLFKSTEKFIQTQIIEKLIADIPEVVGYGSPHVVDNSKLKQQLKERWLL